MRSQPTKYQWLIEAIQNHNSENCLLWPFANTGRYGVVWRGQKQLMCHRVAFLVANGRWPLPLARHTCDVSLCFNPKHILEGTAAENSGDMARRGRAAKGSGNGNSKLTEEKVKAIKAEYGIKNQYTLAAEYGVSQSTISHIIRGGWKHIS